MKINNNLILKILLGLMLSMPLLVYSQDKIILVNGKKINCKIINEATDSVYIISHNGNGNKNSAISKRFIRSVIYNNTNDKTAKNDSIEDKNFEKEKKFRIAVNGGLGFAMGDFGSTDNKSGAGFAKLGPNFDVNFLYKPHTNIGIELKGFMNVNRVDSTSVQDVFGSIKANWYVNSTNWQTSGILGGLVICDPGDVSFELRLLAGVMMMNTPDLELTFVNSWISQPSASSIAAGFDFGFTIEVRVMKNISLLTNIDYLYSKFKFDDIQIQSSDGQLYKNIVAGDSYQKFSALNVNMGLGYRF